MIKHIMDLTKARLAYFVIVSGGAGFLLATGPGEEFSLSGFALFAVGLTLLTMGSFALNQIQEQDLDGKMPRTKQRPLVTGDLTVKSAGIVALIGLVFGTGLLYSIHPFTAVLGLSTVIMYNVLYVFIWKPKWVFGAVPGALPGAMPVVIGFSAVDQNIFRSECIYAFLIMFLWQMPHFWALAIKYKDDYKEGGIPVMPSELGNKSALMHMTLYTISYLSLALLSPLFVPVTYGLYWFLVIPFVFMVAKEFYKYYQSVGERNWLPFFLWVNFSMLAFLLAPVGDQYLFLWISRIAL
ncbi:MAG: protoheme IX farnesyltransferase [Bdellovibrionales bacterium]